MDQSNSVLGFDTSNPHAKTKSGALSVENVLTENVIKTLNVETVKEITNPHSRDVQYTSKIKI